MTIKLQPHQQRMLDERRELSEKLTALRAFFWTDLYKSLPDSERGLLRRQARVMDEYEEVLTLRIASFTKV